MAVSFEIDPLDSIVFSNRTSISSRLFEEIKEKIMTGEFPAGYVFPNEIVLSEKLGVGRTSLREAFHALASFGLITRTKNGTFVNCRKDFIGVTPLSDILKQSDVNDLLEFRIMIESEIAALAAVRATGEEINGLEKIIEHMEQVQDDNEALTKNDTQFHVGLSQACKNKLFVETMHVIRGVYESVLYDIFENDPEIKKHAVVFHKRILGAIRNHDALNARKASHEHILDVLRSVEKHAVK